MNFQDKVRTFMQAVAQNTPTKPTLALYPFALRARLILEEALEFATACGLHVTVDEAGELHITEGYDRHKGRRNIGLNEVTSGPDWAQMIDALCDLLYVTFGAAVAMGVDLTEFFRAVHKSNMEKTTGPIRADGKRLKPEGWCPPNIKGMLDRLLEKNT